jgi:uncharacterized repeat protein (TIGR02543 family)
VPPTNPPTVLDFDPVGWYVSTSLVDLNAQAGFDALTSGTYAGTEYHALDWASFDPDFTLEATADPQGFYPLAGGEKLYVVYDASGGVARVWEDYALYDADGSATGSALKASTYTLLDPTAANYARTTSATDIPGYVALGHRVMSASDYASSDLSDKTKITYGTRPTSPLDSQADSVSVLIEGKNLVANTTPGNYAHVVYYYATDANANGIADTDECTITINFIGKYTDNTTNVVKTPINVIARRDALSTSPDALTKIYVGLDGNIYTSLEQLGVLDISQKDFGAQYSTLDANTSVVSNTDKWIFDVANLSTDTATYKQVVPLYLNNASAQVTFVYNYASDGDIPDIDQYVVEKYKSPSAAKLSDPTKTMALKSEAYTKVAPAISGQVLLGWYRGDFSGIVSGNTTIAKELLALPEFVAAANGSTTAEILANRVDNQVTISFIYGQVHADADGDGWTNIEEYQNSSDLLKAEVRHLSYDSNGGTSAPKGVSTPNLDSYTLEVASVGDMTRDGYTFAGWATSADGQGIIYAPKDLITLDRIAARTYEGVGDEGSNVTLYAIWDSLYADVVGNVQNLTGTDKQVDITLQIGNSTVKEAVSITLPKNSALEYVIENVAPGWYSVVADDGQRKITHGVYVGTKDGGNTASVPRIDFGDDRLQSVLSVQEGAPNVVAAGLPKLFESPAIYTDTDKAFTQTGGMVEIKLDARIVVDTSTLDTYATTQNHQNKQYVELSVTKTLIDNAGTLIDSTKITDLSPSLIDIAIPLTDDVVSAEVCAVHRTHEGSADTLLTSANEYGEYFTQDKRYVVVKSAKFSDYALAQLSGQTPTPPLPPAVPSPSPSNVPKTGDDQGLMLLLLAVTFAAQGIFLMVCARRHRRQQH